MPYKFVISWVVYFSEKISFEHIRSLFSPLFVNAHLSLPNSRIGHIKGSHSLVFVFILRRCEFNCFLSINAYLLLISMWFLAICRILLVTTMSRYWNCVTFFKFLSLHSQILLVCMPFYYFHISVLLPFFKVTWCLLLSPSSQMSL